MEAGDRLGEGGFGEVWKAHNPDLPGSVVAIKVPTKGDVVAALRREGAMQHAVAHPNVVRTITINTANDPPYLVNEYVPGESLRQRLNRVKRFDPREAVEVLSQVLAALGAAHHAGLVHRDVKPENILLGPDGVVKLSDFGLGRLTESAAASVALSRGRNLTEGGGVVGTYHYMSPEQMKGGKIDFRTDLYACGVMLYEMLTGEPHPVRLPIVGAPEGLSEVVDRAMRTIAGNRFHSAQDMIAHIETGLTRERIRPSGRAGRPVAPRQGGAGLVAGCAILVLLLAGMTAFMVTRQTSDVRKQAEIEAARAREVASRAAAARSSMPGATPIRPDPGGTAKPEWVTSIKNGDAALARRDYAAARQAYEDGIVNSELDVDSDEQAKSIVRGACYDLARVFSMLSTGSFTSNMARSLSPADAEDLRTKAFKMLEKARGLGWCDSAGAQAESDLKPLRSDPRWRKLLDSLCR